MTSPAAAASADEDTAPIEALRARTAPCQALCAQSWRAPAPEGFGGLACTHFELSSQGDRVPGHLIEPDHEAGAKRPLLLLQHGAGGDRHSTYLQVARRWVEAGVAVATIDFPLHGERRSPKLSDRLLASISHGLSAEGGPEIPAHGLWRGFAWQAVADLRATLDYLLAHPRIDGERCAYAAFSMGSILAPLFLSVDERPRAAALALGGGGFGPSDLDPLRFIGAFAPRPLLMVNASQDTVVRPRAAEALFAAAGEPKAIEWSDTGHDHLTGAALKRMWEHLREALAP